MQITTRSLILCFSWWGAEGRNEHIVFATLKMFNVGVLNPVLVKYVRHLKQKVPYLSTRQGSRNMNCIYLTIVVCSVGPRILER